MAKSTRSKVKRHFRAKKRTEGVYAAAEAARLNRLHQKLKVLTTHDKDGDVEIPEEAVDSFGDEEGAQQPGWYWFANLGLFDPADVTTEGMQAMEYLARHTAPAIASGSDALKHRIAKGSFESPSSSDEEDDGSRLFSHLFP
ncbi:hypothetical protein EVJ58_g2195 [Rhodofomes roseus]|uniref:DUF2423 domain-containing protein n=1 Tax=Rhodofomes roseus TaxID=34475 RepID=A0A4Y9YRV3_9APHY|nr:hypothetical protein EVJ58_g2195 [Rhodofomes roseus]